MKTLIPIVIIFGLLAVGCTTTYLNLKESSTAQIEEKIIDYQADEDVGAEVILSIRNGGEISGELLSVRDSTMIICTERSATENELANHVYPITIVRNDEIMALTIEGGNYVWTGIGIGALGGAAILGIIVYATTPEDNNSGGTFSSNEGIFSKGGQTAAGIILGALVGAIAGGVVGYILSTDDVILQEIPPGYDMSFLKPLARYPDKEPNFLGAKN